MLHSAQNCIHLMSDFETGAQQRQAWVVGKWHVPAEFEKWDRIEHLRKKQEGENRQSTIVQTKSELKKNNPATTNIPQVSNLDQN